MVAYKALEFGGCRHFHELVLIRQANPVSSEAHDESQAMNEDFIKAIKTEYSWFLDRFSEIEIDKRLVFEALIADFFSLKLAARKTTFRWSPLKLISWLFTYFAFLLAKTSFGRFFLNQCNYQRISRVNREGTREEVVLFLDQCSRLCAYNPVLGRRKAHYAN